MTRRELLALPAVALLPTGCTKPEPYVAVEEKSIDQLADDQLSGVTSVDICKAYLRRIEQLDRSGPKLNSVIELNPDALRIAADLDRERSAKGPRGPLHGIPILLKDNIDTADRMQTTAGSAVMHLYAKPPQDAGLVKRLREAGAVILGKTNLSEWANIRSPRSTSGWSARGGQTRNPYALDRNPSGSSSGSGVAAAASLCAAAIGTETDGSIVSPSSLNGLVGVKPTVGLLSGSGIIPISKTQDTAGPMTRTVRDAAILLSALAEHPKREDYAKACVGVDGMRGLRIGICRQLFVNQPGVQEVGERAVQVLRKAGAEVVDPVEIATLGKFEQDEFQVMLYELKAGIADYFAKRGGDIKNLQDIINLNARLPDKELRYFGQETFLKAQEKGGLDALEYTAALAQCRRLSRDEGIDATIAKHKLDAIFTTTDSPAWPTDWINGDHFTGGSSTVAAVAGYPHITVPGGFVHGLPVGVSFFAGAFAESKLIRIAHAFEQITKVRQKPRYLPTVRYAGEQ
jgi:amidase